jgi:hypothetical protein
VVEPRRLASIAIIAAGALGVATGPARADAIDGDWCLGSGHFAIDGPNILTPGGNRIQGSYSRHAFAYVAPPNEPGAGGRIEMVLLNEETLRLTRTKEASAPEIWLRCKPTS